MFGYYLGMIPIIYHTLKKNKTKYEECLKLREQGYSYGEIKNKLGIPKSTIATWMKLSTMVDDPIHQVIMERNIQAKIRHAAIINQKARETKWKHSVEEVSKCVNDCFPYINDPLFVAGIMLYEAEGAKRDGAVVFSNSDYRLCSLFMKFVERYFNITISDMVFRLHIHETRRDDLQRILYYWAAKLGAPKDKIRITWKKNIVTHRRLNQDYFGQLSVRIIGQKLLTRKILALSTIILTTAGSSNLVGRMPLEH